MPPDAAPLIITRPARPEIVERLVSEGVPPLLARIYATRGVASKRDLSFDFELLAAPDSMLNLRAMAIRLADAIAVRRKLLIIADYDADGATACAVAPKSVFWCRTGSNLDTASLPKSCDSPTRNPVPTS